MPFPVLGSNSAVAEFAIDNSLRFNDNDGAYLSRTPSGAGNRRTFTYSAWVKPAIASATSRALISCGTDSGSNDYIMFNSADRLRFSFDTEASGDLSTNRLFRDPSAWYHVVWAVDTTQVTASNRVKLYVNGTQQTSFASETYPSQNYDTAFNNTEVQRIGARAYSATQYYDGYMSDVYLIDGQQLAPTEFGETNDNGVWIPKAYEGTYGTNGFFLEFQDSGNLGDDTSGNTNDFTATNLTATDQTTDTPTNNFCTGNSLAIFNGNNLPTRIPDYTEGNTVATASNGTTRYLLGTFATSMPYYFEVKVLSTSSTDSSQRIGIVDADAISTSTTYIVEYKADGVIEATGETSDTGNQSITTNDIIGVAVDLATNNNVKLYHNGTLQATMSVGASYQSLSTTPYARLVDATQSFAFNFGNPSFTISSGNSDANGYGNFEYAVPSGYYALCTKNLAEYG